MEFHQVIARFPLVAAAVLGLLLLVAPIVPAQLPEMGYPAVRPLAPIGGSAEDRLRLAQLRGEAATQAFLIRSASSLNRTLEGPDPWQGWGLIPPTVELAWNSDLPFSLNQSHLWASRGMNLAASAGVRARFGWFFADLAPSLVYVGNENFTGRFIWGAITALEHPYRLPWRKGENSIDLPYRFGSRSSSSVGIGSSVVGVEAPSVTFGMSSEDQWWGPAIRNALVISNNAPGFPHLFLRTSEPVATPLGPLDAKLILGALSESDYFDFDPSNDHRALSAFIATWQPNFEPDLTLGITRSVYANSAGRLRIAGHALDALLRWDQLPASDTVRTRNSEQILALFARWLFPASGFEMYTEWARAELPRSLRSFLTDPQRSQGYTLGIQWSAPLRGSDLIRLQGEVSSLENTGKIDGVPTRGHYVSPHVPQGYTHRGRVIGAAIGPGSSGQWFASDYFNERGGAGIFLGRIRWNEDVYRFYYPYPIPGGRDVSIFGGIRAHGRWRGVEIATELGTEKRHNLFFQNWSSRIDQVDAVDVTNRTLRISVTPIQRASSRSTPQHP